GKKVRCRSCATVFLVTARQDRDARPPENTRERKPQPELHANPHEDERGPDREDDGERPRRKRKRPVQKESRMSMPLVATSAFAGAVAVLVIIGLVIWAAKGKKPTAEQAAELQSEAATTSTPRRTLAEEALASLDPLERAITQANQLDPNWRF